MVKGCHSCPNIRESLTKGYGYATDYHCSETGTLLAGYVEWESEKRKDGDFPDDCPLTEVQ